MKNSRSIKTEWLEEDLVYQSRLLFTSFEIRILNLLLAILITVIVRNFFSIKIPREAVITYFMWLFTSAFYLIPFRPGAAKSIRSIEKIHFSFYFFAIIYATILVHYLGGGEWIGFMAYFFDLIYANVLLRRSRGNIITVLAMGAFFILIMLEYNGIIPHYQLFSPGTARFDNPDFVFGTNFFIMGALFFLISYSTGLFSKIKEEREKDLMESKNRFATKAEELESIMLKLKKKIAENIYIKRAAMGYIEKKEFEIQKNRTDLETQIEKLRRTQKSMFFMIEDLNKMSAELKEARDNLEDKVRVRSDELLNISRKLHRSERLAFLGKLAGSVTHELRNPLAVLKNALYVLDTKLKNSKDEKVLYYIKMIEREIMLVDSIIEDIMGFAKTRPPELEKTDLGCLIENIVSRLDVPDTVNVVVDIQQITKVEVDPKQISHAFINISNNAIMAMNGNGILKYRVYEKDEEVCVEIEDTGPGIPPDQRDLIFEPLYSSKPKGTGLGLPIAKMMIENHDGRIEFTSEPGEGTIFRIFFPKKVRKRGD